MHRLKIPPKKTIREDNVTDVNITGSGSGNISIDTINLDSPLGNGRIDFKIAILIVLIIFEFLTFILAYRNYSITQQLVKVFKKNV